MKSRRCKPHGREKPPLLGLSDCGLSDCGDVIHDVLCPPVAVTREEENTLLLRISF